MKVKGRLYNTHESLVVWPTEGIDSLVGKPITMQGTREVIGTITSTWVDDDGWVCFEAEGDEFPEFLSSTEVT